MLLRLIALGLGIFFVGLVVVMASVTLFVREPLPILSLRVPVEFSGGTEMQPIAARMTVDGVYRFQISLQSDHDDDAPMLALVRPSDDVTPIPVEVARAGEGWHGEGQFTLPGRWDLHLQHGDQREIFAFVLRE